MGLFGAQADICCLLAMKFSCIKKRNIRGILLLDKQLYFRTAEDDAFGAEFREALDDAQVILF